MTKSPFDLVLSYPQWQGSGRHDNLRRGARAAAAVCSEFGPVVHVADAGDGTTMGRINRWSAIVEQFNAAQAMLEEHRPRRLLTAGGDCASDIVAIDYLHRLYPDLTVIWVDAHLDANTAETSPSGDFHGMPVAAIMGAAPPALRPLLGAPLPPSQFRYASAHVGDEGEWAFQRGQALAWLEPGTDVSGPIHVHFDLDVFDPTEFPYLAYRDGRLPIEAGVDLVRRLAAAGTLVGLTITEFAPDDEAGAREGGAVLRRICEAAACVSQ